MRIRLSWLQQIVDCRLPPRDLAYRLTMAGLEAEAFEEEPPEPARSAVAARIESVSDHPGAERLVVCQVAVGRGHRVSVVCGAPNVQAGETVAYAPPGSRLANGGRVELVRIRGIESVGVLCSEAELGLGPEGSRLLTLPRTVRPGTPVGAALGVGGWVLEITVTPNRGDCLSVMGVAREAAALTGAKLDLSFQPPAEGKSRTRDQVKVEIQAPDLCGRYAARIVRGVRVGPSPFWLRRELEVAGIRAINNVVDVTNFVMLERGQPLHAFDLECIEGAQIVVRRASAEERFRTLDGIDRVLVPEDLVICDRSRPIALAGIMGGENSEIGESTRDVLLESAFFVPSTIRATRRRLGISSESSYRFERGVDPQGVIAALDRAAALVQQLGGGDVCQGVVEARGARRRPSVIRLQVAEVGKLLGLKTGSSEVSRRLRSLGAKVRRGGRGELIVTAPSHRFDLAQEVDLIEEVARLKGYDCVPATLPRAETAPDPPPRALLVERTLRSLLLGQGLTEMIVPPFVSAEENASFPPWSSRNGGAPVRLLNPLSHEQGELRQSLLPGLLRALRHNLYRGETGVSAFSVGKIYWVEHSGNCSERRLLAGVLCGRRPLRGIGTQRERNDFAHAKGVVESVIERVRMQGVKWEAARVQFLHPGKAAQACADSQVIGIVGALHPRIQEDLGVSIEPFLFELDLQAIVDYAPPRSIFQPLPRFPSVRRDLSLVVREGLQAGEITSAIEALGNELIEGVEVFDQYRGAQIAEGYKSLTYSIAYRAGERTLTDQEVNEIHEQVVKKITERFGIAVRT